MKFIENDGTGKAVVIDGEKLHECDGEKEKKGTDLRFPPTAMGNASMRTQSAPDPHGTAQPRLGVTWIGLVHSSSHLCSSTTWRKGAAAFSTLIPSAWLPFPVSLHITNPGKFSLLNPNDRILEEMHQNIGKMNKKVKKIPFIDIMFNT